MQAENTHSRQKRQRLWYQRDGFLWGLVVALIAAAWGLLPPAGTSLGIGGWLGMGLYMLLAAVPMIVTTMDKRRPQLAGTAAALGFPRFARAGVLPVFRGTVGYARHDVLQQGTHRRNVAHPARRA